MSQQQVIKAYETSNEPCRRTVKNVVCSTDLHDPPPLHHRNGVRERRRFLLIVRDQDRCRPEPFVQLPQFTPQLSAQRRVKIGERLVKKQDRRLVDKSARQRNTLLLPTGELAWASVQH